MTDRPLITAADLMGLVGHGLQRDPSEDVGEWIQRNGFEPEALVVAARFMVETCREATGVDLDAQTATVLALGSFTFGWDAHRDLRGERDDGTA